MKRKEADPSAARPIRPAAAPQPLQPPARGLEDEIVLLRRAVRRLFDLSQGQDDGEAVKTLNILSAAAARLARLVQTQAQLSGPDGDVEALLLQALTEVREEMGI